MSILSRLRNHGGPILFNKKIIEIEITRRTILTRKISFFYYYNDVCRGIWCSIWWTISSCWNVSFRAIMEAL